MPRRRRPSARSGITAAVPATGAELSRRRRQGEGFYFVEPALTDAQIERARLEETSWLVAIPSHVAELKRMFAGYDAFQIIRGLQRQQEHNDTQAVDLRNPFVDSPSPVEYASMILLERRGRGPEQVPDFPLDEVLARALPHLEALVSEGPGYFSGYWSSPRDPLAVLRERFVRRFMFVSFNETMTQAGVLLERLFSTPLVSRWLVDSFGVDVRGLVAFVQQLLLLVTDISVVDNDAYDRNEGVPPVYTGFTAAALGERAGVDAMAVAKLLDLLSHRFGEPQSEWPRLPTAMRHRPLIRDDEGNYMPAIPARVVRGLRLTLAAALNPAIDSLPYGDSALSLT